MRDARSLASQLLATVDAKAERFLLGITGPPGAGKSTLALELAAALAEQRGAGFAVVAPLDGFHLSNETLDSLGLRSVKGAPETFDGAAFVASVRRLRHEPDVVLLWPDFDRAVERTVPDAISIGPPAKLVITEGNYLLLNEPPWSEVRALLDQVWYVDAPVEVLRRRLIERQLVGGLSEEGAARHVDESDLRNAELVARTRQLANLTVMGTLADDSLRRGA